MRKDNKKTDKKDNKKDNNRNIDDTFQFQLTWQSDVQQISSRRRLTSVCIEIEKNSSQNREENSPRMLRIAGRRLDLFDWNFYFFFAFFRVR
jgi:TFIIF-interacting CTD phosphatase-like protein